MVSHAEFVAKTRYPSLDGLRCLAITPVVFHHSTPRPLPGFFGQGPLGVHLFFALSGFLIPSLLLAEERLNGRIRLPAFYARRALRIFPLYYAVLSLYVAHALFVRAPSPERTDFLRDLPFFATYTGNFLAHYDVSHPVVFGFSWSLATEEQFYLLFPPLLVLLGTAGLRAALVSGFLLLDYAAEHGALSGVLGAGALFRAVTSISAPMCLGALAAIALPNERPFRFLAAVLGRRASGAICLAALLLLVSAGAPLVLVHLAMAALVVAVALRDDDLLAPLLQHRWLRHVGTVSYGIYLLHVAVITAVKTALPPALRDASGVVFALSFPLSIAAATASYRWFETPFLRAAGRFRSVPAKTAAV